MPLPVTVDRDQGIKHVFDFACTFLAVTAARSEAANLGQHLMLARVDRVDRISPNQTGGLAPLQRPRSALQQI
jgi:hypothetical protein